MLGLYGLLTLLLTYPLPLHLATSARDWGDPFLSSWIMAWQLDRWAGLDFSGYFDTNVFYPHLRTLAYSEFLVPQTLLAAPVYYLTANALLAHNMVMLLAFTSNAFCAYLLVKHFANDRGAAFVGGFIFAFNPFMFDHLSHLQVISAAGIPLAFLWLHRYFEAGSYRYMALFTATYVGQALANAYYAVYLTYACGAYILYRAILGKHLANLRLGGHLAAHGVVSAALLAPFFVQYVHLQSTMGFRRQMAEVSGWPFLAVPLINRLYGGVMHDWASSEAKLFPGFLAALLVLLGIACVLRERARASREQADRGRAERLYRVLGWVAFVAALAVIGVASTGGFRTSILGITVSVRHYTNPALTILTCVVARFVLRRRHAGLRELARNAFGDEVFYVGMLCTVAVLALGERGPYRLLFEYAPGFGAIRAVPRIHVLTMVAAAVLAGIALQQLRASVAWLAPRAAVAVIGALIGAEYLAVPVPLFMPDPPPYVDQRWLAERPGDYSVIYYPVMPEYDAQRMYRSLLHGRNIVNGLSGFPAPVYTALTRLGFPTEHTLEALEALGLRYVVVDQAYYHHRAVTIRQQLRRLEPRLRRVAELGDYLVYEVQAPWLTRQQLYARLAAAKAEVRSLARDDWRLRVSENPREAAFAIDGDAATRWRTREQEAGMAIAVDLGAPHPLAGVSLALSEWPADVPVGWHVDVSDDGFTWRTVWLANDYEVPITEFLAPLDMHAEARFTTDARHLRVVISETREGLVWSIAELEVLTPAGR